MMNVMAVLMSIGILAGFSLLLYGVFFQRNDYAEEAKGDSDTLERIKMSVEEADTTLSNINSVSSLIIEEIDVKYKELLFLYQILEEKKKELLEQTSGHQDNEEPTYDYYEREPVFSSIKQDEPREASDYKANLEILEISRKMDEVKRFPKLHNKAEIMELHSKGFDITGIARELGIGKGEVKLILGLNKVGAGYD